MPRTNAAGLRPVSPSKSQKQKEQQRASSSAKATRSRAAVRSGGSIVSDAVMSHVPDGMPLNATNRFTAGPWKYYAGGGSPASRSVMAHVNGMDGGAAARPAGRRASSTTTTTAATAAAKKKKSTKTQRASSPARSPSPPARKRSAQKKTLTSASPTKTKSKTTPRKRSGTTTAAARKSGSSSPQKAKRPPLKQRRRGAPAAGGKKKTRTTRGGAAGCGADAGAASTNLNDLFVDNRLTSAGQLPSSGPSASQGLDPVHGHPIVDAQPSTLPPRNYDTVAFPTGSSAHGLPFAPASQPVTGPATPDFSLVPDGSTYVPRW